MVPNEGYWNPDRKPTVQIVFDNIMSKADALKAVAAGDKKLDIVTMLTPAEAKAFDGNGHAHIQSKNAKTALAAVFNQTEANSPWKNIAVRKSHEHDRRSRGAAQGRGRWLRHAHAGVHPEGPVWL